MKMRPSRLSPSPRKKPLRVLLDVRVVRRALEREVQRDVDVRGVRVEGGVGRADYGLCRQLALRSGARWLLFAIAKKPLLLNF